MITLNDIYAAQKRISPYVHPSPLLFSHLLEEALQKQIWLKLESQQPTGSFKIRPAFNGMLFHSKEAKERGVVAFSAGNFAQAVAFAAKKLGVKATIIMRETTSHYKIQRTKKLGATVVLCGNYKGARKETTDNVLKKTGSILLDPYNSLETIAADGTIGLELIEHFGNELNKMTLLIPVSGGGLIAGIAFAIKSNYPQCQIIGVQPKKSASLTKALKAGHPVHVRPFSTLADVLTLTEIGENPFALIQQHVDDVILVDEKSIQLATQFFIEQHKLVVEPSGAVSLAALRSQSINREKVICLISGGNIKIELNHLKKR